MSRNFASIETPLGIVKGRDGIFLDEVTLSDQINTLVLEGALNTALCSKTDKAIINFKGFRITFTGVLAIEIVELDSSDWDGESCFDEVLNSDWIKQLKGKVTAQYRHFVVLTYDNVIETVCDSFTCELTNSKTEQDAAANP